VNGGISIPSAPDLPIQERKRDLHGATVDSDLLDTAEVKRPGREKEDR